MDIRKYEFPHNQGKNYVSCGIRDYPIVSSDAANHCIVCSLIGGDSGRLDPPGWSEICFLDKSIGAIGSGNYEGFSFRKPRHVDRRSLIEGDSFSFLSNECRVDYSLIRLNSGEKLDIVDGCGPRLRVGYGDEQHEPYQCFHNATPGGKRPIY